MSGSIFSGTPFPFNSAAEMYSNETTPMDVDMDETEQSMMMDIDPTPTITSNSNSNNTAAAAAISEDLDVLAMDLDTAFQGLGSTPAVAPVAQPSSPPPPTRRSKVKYYYEYKALEPFATSSSTRNTDEEFDFAFLRRNIHHLDSLLRNLATEPYEVRRMEIKKTVYRPFAHMSRVVGNLHRLGLIDESRTDVGPYVRHLRNLKPIIMALGSVKDDDTRTKRAVIHKLERTQLPESRIIKIKTSRARSNSSTGSSSGSTGSSGTSHDLKMDNLTRLMKRMNF